MFKLFFMQKNMIFSSWNAVTQCAQYTVLLLVSPIGSLHYEFHPLEALLFQCFPFRRRKGEGPSGGVFGSLRSRAIRATRVEPYMVMEQRERRDGLLRRLLQPDMERLAVQNNYTCFTLKVVGAQFVLQFSYPATCECWLLPYFTCKVKSTLHMWKQSMNAHTYSIQASHHGRKLFFVFFEVQTGCASSWHKTLLIVKVVPFMLCFDDIYLATSILQPGSQVLLSNPAVCSIHCLHRLPSFRAASCGARRAIWSENV